MTDETGSLGRSRAGPGRPDRHLRLGQVHLRPPALRPLRGDLQRLLPRPGRRRRERPGGHGRRLRRAALHRRQAAGRRAAHRRRRHQRPADGPARRWSSWPASTTCCRSRSCSTCREKPSRWNATRPGPTGTSARTSSGASSDRAAPVAARAGAGGVPQGARPARDRARSNAAVDRAARSCSTTTGTAPARSTSSATSTAAAPSWRPCSASSATRSPGTRPGRPVDAVPPARAAPRSSSATWSTAARTPPACCGW